MFGGSDSDVEDTACFDKDPALALLRGLTTSRQPPTKTAIVSHRTRAEARSLTDARNDALTTSTGVPARSVVERGAFQSASRSSSRSDLAPSNGRHHEGGVLHRTKHTVASDHQRFQGRYSTGLSQLFTPSSRGVARSAATTSRILATADETVVMASDAPQRTSAPYAPQPSHFAHRRVLQQENGEEDSFSLQSSPVASRPVAIPDQSSIALNDRARHATRHDRSYNVPVDGGCGGGSDGGRGYVVDTHASLSPRDVLRDNSANTLSAQLRSLNGASTPMELAARGDVLESLRRSEMTDRERERTVSQQQSLARQSEENHSDRFPSSSHHHQGGADVSQSFTSRAFTRHAPRFGERSLSPVEAREGFLEALRCGELQRRSTDRESSRRQQDQRTFVPDSRYGIVDGYRDRTAGDKASHEPPSDYQGHHRLRHDYHHRHQEHGAAQARQAYNSDSGEQVSGCDDESDSAGRSVSVHGQHDDVNDVQVQPSQVIENKNVFRHHSHREAVDHSGSDPDDGVQYAQEDCGHEAAGPDLQPRDLPVLSPATPPPTDHRRASANANVDTSRYDYTRGPVVTDQVASRRDSQHRGDSDLHDETIHVHDDTVQEDEAGEHLGHDEGEAVVEEAEEEEEEAEEETVGNIDMTVHQPIPVPTGPTFDTPTPAAPSVVMSRLPTEGLLHGQPPHPRRDGGGYSALVQTPRDAPSGPTSPRGDARAEVPTSAVSHSVATVHATSTDLENPPHVIHEGVPPLSAEGAVVTSTDAVRSLTPTNTSSALVSAAPVPAPYSPTRREQQMASLLAQHQRVIEQQHRDLEEERRRRTDLERRMATLEQFVLSASMPTTRGDIIDQVHVDPSTTPIRFTGNSRQAPQSVDPAPPKLHPVTVESASPLPRTPYGRRVTPHCDDVAVGGQPMFTEQNQPATENSERAAAHARGVHPVRTGVIVAVQDPSTPQGPLISPPVNEDGQEEDLTGDDFNDRADRKASPAGVGVDGDQSGGRQTVDVDALSPLTFGEDSSPQMDGARLCFLAAVSPTPGLNATAHKSAEDVETFQSSRVLTSTHGQPGASREDKVDNRSSLARTSSRPRGVSPTPGPTATARKSAEDVETFESSRVLASNNAPGVSRDDKDDHRSSLVRTLSRPRGEALSEEASRTQRQRYRAALASVRSTGLSSSRSDARDPTSVLSVRRTSADRPEDEDHNRAVVPVTARTLRLDDSASGVASPGAVADSRSLTAAASPIKREDVSFDGRRKHAKAVVQSQKQCSVVDSWALMDTDTPVDSSPKEKTAPRLLDGLMSGAPGHHHEEGKQRQAAVSSLRAVPEVPEGKKQVLHEFVEDQRTSFDGSGTKSSTTAAYLPPPPSPPPSKRLQGLHHVVSPVPDRSTTPTTGDKRRMPIPAPTVGIVSPKLHENEESESRGILEDSASPSVSHRHAIVALAPPHLLSDEPSSDDDDSSLKGRPAVVLSARGNQHEVESSEGDRDPVALSPSKKERRGDATFEEARDHYVYGGYGGDGDEEGMVSPMAAGDREAMLRRSGYESSEVSSIC